MLAESEVGQVDMLGVTVAGPAQQHVPRLDVAMDQAVRVRGVQGRGDLASDFERAGRAQPAVAVEQRPDVAMADVAHRNEQHAA